MTIELWLGSEFEHAHEMHALRLILNQFNERFGASPEMYFLFANFFVENEEIDMAILKERAVVIVELKDCDQPVNGGPNGDWTTADGHILNQGRKNPYVQARKYRYALMNYLSVHRSQFLPEQRARQMKFDQLSSLIVFSPTYAKGSRVEVPERDRKWFKVLGLPDLWSEVYDRRSNEMKLDDGSIRKLAAQVLRLKRVSVSDYLGLPEMSAPAPEPGVQAIPTPPEPEKVILPAQTPTVPAVSLQTPIDRGVTAPLQQPIALDIITALRRGTVPSTGLEHLVVGLDREKKVIGSQLRHVATGRGDFKFVRGSYGAGKTFLTAMVLEEALKQNFAVSPVVVSVDTPIYRLESIYHRIIASLRTRGQAGGALRGLIDRWIYQIEEKIIELEGLDENNPLLSEKVEAQIENGLAEMAQIHSAFPAAIRGYYRAQIENDYPTAQGLIGWLSGEGQISASVKRKVNIRGDIDNTVALEFLKAINLIIRKAGLAGLAIAFDEVETIQRLRQPQREQSLSTLRQLVDGADHGQFPYTYMFFTGTPGFFEDRYGVPSLQPLHDRIKLDRPDDPYPNPELPQINLPAFNAEKLKTVAEKVITIYERAYEPVDKQRITPEFIDFMVDEVTSKFGGRVDVVPRQFLRDFINVLDKARQYPAYNPNVEYEFDRDEISQDLTSVEQELIEPITF